MTAVFSAPQNVRGAMKADRLRVQFGPIQSGMLVQTVNFTYSMPVSMLYEIGSTDVYIVTGRAAGQAGITNVVGPSSISARFIEQFGDACRVQDNKLQFRTAGGCGGAANAGTTYRLDGCVLNPLGVSLSAQDVLVNQSLSMMFVNLDKS